MLIKGEENNGEKYIQRKEKEVPIEWRKKERKIHHTNKIDKFNLGSYIRDNVTRRVDE